MKRIIVTLTLAFVALPTQANESIKPLNADKLQSLDVQLGTQIVNLSALAPNGLFIHHVSVATSSPSASQNCTALVTIAIDGPARSYGLAIASVSARGGSNAINRSFSRPLKVKYEPTDAAELRIGHMSEPGCANSANLLVQPRGGSGN